MNDIIRLFAGNLYLYINVRYFTSCWFANLDLNVPHRQLRPATTGYAAAKACG